METGKEILSKMGRYPVIKLNLKGAKQPDFERAFLMLRKEIIDEYGRHAYLRDSQVLEEKDRERFTDLLLGEIRWNRQVSTLHTP